jgi:hypothetical protein
MELERQIVNSRFGHKKAASSMTAVTQSQNTELHPMSVEPYQGGMVFKPAATVSSF